MNLENDECGEPQRESWKGEEEREFLFFEREKGVGICGQKARGENGRGIGLWLSGTSSFLFSRHIEWNWGPGERGWGPSADVVPRWIRWEFGGGCVRMNVLQFIFFTVVCSFCND